MVPQRGLSTQRVSLLRHGRHPRGERKISETGGSRPPCNRARATCSPPCRFPSESGGPAQSAPISVPTGRCNVGAGDSTGVEQASGQVLCPKSWTRGCCGNGPPRTVTCSRKTARFRPETDAKRYSPKLKFQVVTELLQSGKSTSQVARAYDVHRNTVRNWEEVFQ